MKHLITARAIKGAAQSTPHAKPKPRNKAPLVRSNSVFQENSPAHTAADLYPKPRPRHRSGSMLNLTHSAVISPRRVQTDRLLADARWPATRCALISSLSFADGFHLTRQQLRLIASLVGHALIGEPVDNPVLRRRLIELTKAVGEFREIVKHRGNGMDDFEQSAAQSMHLHDIARRLAFMAIEADGMDIHEALPLAAEALSSAACDEGARAILYAYALRIAPGEQIEHIVGNQYSRPEFGERRHIGHEMNALRSHPADGLPPIYADPQAGAVDSPEPAALRSVARFKDMSFRTASFIHDRNAPEKLRSHARSKTHFQNSLHAEIEGFQEDKANELKAESSAPTHAVHKDLAWPSLSIFDPEFAARCKASALHFERHDPGRLCEHVTAMIELVLGTDRAPPPAVVDTVIEELKALDRVV